MYFPNIFNATDAQELHIEKSLFIQQNWRVSWQNKRPRSALKFFSQYCELYL